MHEKSRLKACFFRGVKISIRRGNKAGTNIDRALIKRRLNAG